MSNLIEGVAVKSWSWSLFWHVESVSRDFSGSNNQSRNAAKVEIQGNIRVAPCVLDAFGRSPVWIVRLIKTENSSRVSDGTLLLRTAAVVWLGGKTGHLFQPPGERTGTREISKYNHWLSAKWWRKESIDRDVSWDNHKQSTPIKNRSDSPR